jgi:glycosyltransferase involved in cell wall biosynthesis
MSGGIAEGIIRDETGFAISGLDACAFAEKISWLYNHPNQRRLMGEKAAVFSKQHYSSEHLNKKLIQIYQQIS